jgi:hypothetical protein
MSPHKSAYLLDIHQSYHRLIDEQVRIPLNTVSSGIKPSSLRVPLPEKYSHIVLTAMYLGEKAKTWFNDNVKGINCRRRVWTFKPACMISLYTSHPFRTLHRSFIL